MHYRSILKALGAIILIIAISLLVPTVLAFFDNLKVFYAFLYSIGLTTLFGGALILLPRSKDNLTFRDGFAVVSIGWFSAALFGALPYLFSGETLTFTDAFFEAISGFTTTGSSIFADIESLPKSILLWRSMTQWLGGMGIIVLSLAIIPYLDIGGMSIFQAEVPGLTAERLTPRIQDTAKYLWLVYCLMTLVLMLILWATEMNFFDAINHAFTTLATGGFSTKNSSIASFNSPRLEWILTLFMLLAGVNFALHFRFLGKLKQFKFSIKNYLLDDEFRFYVTVSVTAVIGITLSLLFTNKLPFEKALRDASFLVASIVTTTGFGSADYELWAVFAQFILMFLMIMGGCAGSTGGGVKVVRILLIFKYMYIELLKLVHPNLVRNIKIRKESVEKDVIASALGFIFIYTSVLMISILLVTLETDNMLTAIGGVISSLSNVGPGFGTIGPTENFAHLGTLTKWVFAIDMLMGRLELLTVIILFFPQSWRK
ncbi:MAG: trk system potassium uptake protein TrkH [bacterium]|jgi:trk system potassium uptake protein TrkH